VNCGTPSLAGAPVAVPAEAAHALSAELSAEGVVPTSVSAGAMAARHRHAAHAKAAGTVVPAGAQNALAADLAAGAGDGMAGPVEAVRAMEADPGT
jgi:hypothetical protein